MRLENPSNSLYEVLKNAKSDLEEMVTPSLLSAGKPLSEVDVYDFIELLINKGEASEATSKVVDLLPALREKERAYDKTLKQQSPQSVNATTPPVIASEAQAIHEIPQDLQDIIFKDIKGKEHTLTKQTQEQWLQTFGLKNLEQSYTPKYSEEIKEALGGKEIRLQKGSLLKLVSQGRQEFIPQVKAVLDEPDLIIKEPSEEILLAKHLKNEDYFVNVSFDNGEYLVSISNGIKETRNLQNKLNAGAKIIYQSPNANSISQTLLQTSQYSANKIDNVDSTTTLHNIQATLESYKDLPEIKRIDTLLAKDKDIQDRIQALQEQASKLKSPKGKDNARANELSKQYQSLLEDLESNHQSLQKAREKFKTKEPQAYNLFLKNQAYQSYKAKSNPLQSQIPYCLSDDVFNQVRYLKNREATRKEKNDSAYNARLKDLIESKKAQYQNLLDNLTNTKNPIAQLKKLYYQLTKIQPKGFHNKLSAQERLAVNELSDSIDKTLHELLDKLPESNKPKKLQEASTRAEEFKHFMETTREEVDYILNVDSSKLGEYFTQAKAQAGDDSYKLRFLERLEKQTKEAENSGEIRSFNNGRARESQTEVNRSTESGIEKEDIKDFAKFLQDLPTSPQPTKLSSDEIAELISRFDNVENLKEHLATRANPKNREDLFNLLESTIENPLC